MSCAERCALLQGFKVNRMPAEKWTDVAEVGGVLRKSLEGFAAATGRKLKLEIEPGTSMVARAGSLVQVLVPPRMALFLADQSP